MPAKQVSADNNQPSERVFLIDSMSHIFRAYFAPMANRVAPLGTSTGQVTQAVYIFTNMLRKLLQDEKPNYIAAIFESKRRRFVTKLLPATKPTAWLCPTIWRRSFLTSFDFAKR
jgi:5'-3' exonuclease